VFFGDVKGKFSFIESKKLYCFKVQSEGIGLNLKHLKRFFEGIQ
jgi:hypothetical protein